MAFELMNSHQFKIDTTPEGVATLVALAKGVKNVEISNNEETDQTKYLDGSGYAETDVIGAQTTLEFTADRDYEDEGQNFIFGTMLEVGPGRRTKFEWTEPDGGKFSGPCTITDINPGSGDAGAKAECSWAIHFNGKPVYTPPAP